MERFEESLRIAAPPERVWEVLVDPAQVPRWLSIARRVDADGAPGEGQRLVVTGGHLGVSRTITATVDVWQPTERYGWAVDDPVTLRFRYDLHGGGSDDTRLRAEVRADLTGLPRMTTRLAVRSLRREFHRSVRDLGELATG